MTQLRMIGVAFVLVVAFIVLLRLLFEWEEQEPDAVTQFESELEAAYADHVFGYALLENQAVGRFDPDCREIPINRTNPVCEDLVGTLREIDPQVVSTIGLLNELITHVPPGVAPDVAQSAQDLLSLATRVHESNVILIEGWDANDSNSWKQGWAMKDSIAVDSDAPRDSRANP